MSAPDPTDPSAVVRHQLQELASLTERTAATLSDDVAALAARVLEVFANGGKLLFCGNGGSAAEAQHLAAEYVVRFRRHRRSLPAVALTTDTSVLTAAGNDYGFADVFARQVQALGRPGDLLILHSTSGDSENLLRAAEAAGAGGLVTVAFLARGGGRLRGVVDHALVVDTESTARAQEVHLALGHAVCELVDRVLAETEEGP